MATADQILSLSEVKDHLEIPPEDSTKDVLLTGYRDSAIEHVESVSGRHLLDDEFILEVPVRYEPLSSMPFRASDLKMVRRVDYWSEDTEYWNAQGWDSTYLPVGVPYDFAGLFGYSIAYPARGLKVYRTEAATPPDLHSASARLDKLDSKNLWRVWPFIPTDWPNIHTYLPLRLTCSVGMETVPAVFKSAAMVYVRFLWSQMPEFKEADTIDRILRGQTHLNLDERAQRVIQVS